MRTEPIRDFAFDIEFFPFDLKQVVDVVPVPTEETPSGIWCRFEVLPAPQEEEA